MKNLIFFFITLSTFVFGCKKNSETKTTNYEFEINTSKSIGASTLVLKSISDNRCPVNADCISAGGATVYFKLTGNNVDQEITLCKGVCGALESVKNLKINGINYSLKLIDITPYPQLQKSAITQTVKVELTKA
ncbi:MULTISPECIES: hypothetical protein [unclassified Pedobacter]|uniref:hypothetical protein n=1 Tax=unclassified Pedobacter TaxID=2628915 RepID=UPI001423F250|nr:MULTISPECIES: hypothetical protein [unclassified Pedobacter]NII83909.1 hypothetical protein [Pedobacter sp. SG908]NMN37783.1 hypothetical protein [Pedobacter sp. SG918]